MSYSFLLLLLVFVLHFQVNAQKAVDFQAEPTFTQRLYKGAGLSFQVGDVSFYDVSPFAGYMFNELFSTGLGFTYRYRSYRFQNFNNNVIGGRVFGRVNISQNLFLYGEFENLSAQVFAGNEIVREWVPGLFSGIGYQIDLGPSDFALNIVGMFNHSYNRAKFVYNNPWNFRVLILF